MELESALMDFNPWWQREFKIKYIPRQICEKIKKFAKMPLIIALTGLRRVGKTTIMQKMIIDKIAEGYAPQNIMYFSFDEYKGLRIRDLLKEYSSVMKKDFYKENYFFLFDEVQKLEDWENQIKVVYDTYKNVRIIISGSESLFLRKKSKESLAGRIFEFHVKPLSFKEYLLFKEFKINNPKLQKEDIRKLFEQFMYSGGFPEIVSITDKEIIRKYLQETVIEKIIYNDIPHSYSIKEPALLESIFKMIAEEPGQLLDINKASREIGVSRQTLSLYLKYLEDSYLISKLYNFSRNKRKIGRKLRKYYSTIPSLALIRSDDILTKSKVFENIIVQQLDAEFFWRDAYKNEVDIVQTAKRILPIEVKYRDKIETEGLTRFMNTFSVKEGIILSRDSEGEIKEKGVRIIPAYIFLLNEE